MAEEMQQLDFDINALDTPLHSGIKLGTWNIKDKTL